MTRSWRSTRPGFRWRSSVRTGARLVYRAEDTEFIVSRPSDVPVFVEYGAADVGIVGKDVLEEQQPNVVELRDLGTGGAA